MKILHLIPSYLPARLASGPIIPTHNLNKELVKRGVGVVVYTTNLDGKKILDVPLGQEVNIDGVKVFYFPITFRPWQYSFAMHQALAKNIKNFDLVHITSVFLSVSTLGAYYAKKFKKPYIISPHGSLMTEPLKRGSLKKEIYIQLIEKRNLANASAIHFLVEKEKEDYLKANLPLKKAIIIPNSLSSEEFKEKPMPGFFRNKFKIPQSKKVILFLGRLHPIKGLDTLIPGFSEIIKKELEAILVLAGPDDEGYKRNIQLLITNYQLQDKVIFAGMISGPDKIAAFQESDVFVLPSYTECLSMALIEAMSFGLPVVITKGVGTSKEVERAGAGLVVEKDVKQVAEAILKILENPVMAKKMGEVGREFVKKKFSTAEAADLFIKAYADAVNRDK